MRAELEASTDEEQDLFRQMIERIEEDGYGKKWCFGDYHESVSPLCWRAKPRLNTKHNYLAYLNSNSGNELSKLRLIFEEKNGNELHLRFVGTAARYGPPRDDFLQERRKQHFGTHALRFRPVYNYDETDDSEQRRAREFPNVSVCVKYA